MRIKDSEMQARKALLVNYIATRTARSGTLQVSRSSLATELGLSVSQVRRVMVHVVNQGLVRVVPRYSSSGAQVENAYQVTPYGRRCLKRGDMPK